MPVLCLLHSMQFKCWQPIAHSSMGIAAFSPQQHALQVLGVDGAAAVIVLSPQVNKLVKVVRAQLPALQQAARKPPYILWLKQVVRLHYIS
jgi:hypothetical protein